MLAIDRRLCDPRYNPEAFSDFVRIAWKHIDPADLVWERPMDEICKHLQAVSAGLIDRLMINVPPGLSKSMLCCVLYNAWVWGPARKPRTRFLYISYDESLVLRDARKCKELMLSDWYQARWEMELKVDSKSNGYFTNHKFGYRISTTIRAGVTGKHCDVAIIDDPQKPLALARATADGESLESQLPWDFYRNTLPTRFSDHAKAKKIMIMQRLGDNDLCGRLLAEAEENPETSEHYEHLMLPMEYDPERHCTTSVGGDWRTQAGELLAPVRFGAVALASLKAGFGGSTRAIQTQLNQNPTPAGGTYFTSEMFREYSEFPGHGLFEFTWDLGLKGGQNHDPNVGQMWLRSGMSRYWLRGFEFRADLLGTVPVMHDVMRACIEWARALRRTGKHRWFPSGILVEDKANGPAAVLVLKSQKWPCKITAWDPGRANKAERAEAAAACFGEIAVHLPSQELQDSILSQRLSVHEVPASVALTQWLKFPGGRHDDHVDAMTQYMLHSADRGMTGVDLLHSLTKGRGV